LHRKVLSERTTHARALFAGLPDDYGAMGAALSFGQDPRWRRFLVSQMPRTSARMLDVAAGTGLVTRRLLADGRADSVVALDQSEPMLRVAAQEDDTRARFVLGQAERLPFADDMFDALTVTYLLRYVDDPAAVMAELVRVVRPEGVVASLEFAVPEGLAYPAWWFYTRLAMPAIGRLVSPAWYEVGRFLGPSIEGFWRRYPLATQLGWWRAAGIGAVRWRRMSLGGGIVVWGVKGS
jgi:demethylmenaquinone methyltransferase/2-methoxy-6-polyprenyl-1,4-benzoquinol methylase